MTTGENIAKIILATFIITLGIFVGFVFNLNGSTVVGTSIMIIGVVIAFIIVKRVGKDKEQKK